MAGIVFCPAFQKRDPDLSCRDFAQADRLVPQEQTEGAIVIAAHDFQLSRRANSEFVEILQKLAIPFVHAVDPD